MSIGVANRRQSDRSHSRLPDASSECHLSYSRTASARRDLSIICSSTSFVSNLLRKRSAIMLTRIVNIYSRASIAMTSVNKDKYNVGGC